MTRFEAVLSQIPPGLAWPLSAASTLLAVIGGGLVMYAAALGSITAVVWALACFLVAGALWYAADYAGAGSDR
jgi:hypothetical protein